jgi:hypothetical protein
MLKPTLLILAAGMGSRYGGLKQIDPIGPGGETIMDYSIYDAHRAGFGKAVFVIRKQIEQPFRQSIGARFEKRIPIDYVFQELDNLPQGFALPAGRTRPWGTTHAILAAAHAIREPFAVINSDDFYGAASFRGLAGALLSAANDYSMVGFALRDTLSPFGPVSRGVCRLDKHGFLHDIVELKSIEQKNGRVVSSAPDGALTNLTGNETVSMNMWGFTPQIFPQLDASFEQFLRLHGADLNAECYIPNTVNDLIRAGHAQVRVLPCGGAWFGVTYRLDRDRAVENIRRLIEAGQYPERLWA